MPCFEKKAALAAAHRATDLLPLSQNVLDGTLYLAPLAKIEARVGETLSALDHVEQWLALPLAMKCPRRHCEPTRSGIGCAMICASKD
jgi:hypothetical protein